MAHMAEAESFLKHKYTHIVVGGGTAGLVVAARLSENPALTVGVLEAGPAALDEPKINVPGLLGETLFTEYDWQFETTPQPGFNGRKLPWNRGKVLGGSSALNFMMWNRGNKGDYDTWERLGNKGWGWDGMLPFFKKSERFQVPDKAYQERHNAYFDQNYHGTDGPLHTIYSAEYGESNSHWHATLNNVGVHTNRSHLSGSNVGCWTSLAGVDPESQQRCYSARAYYLPASKRDNLKVLTNAMVRSVLLEEEGDDCVARGVKFSHDGTEHIVKVRGEIILSCGSVQSPQLLELSGIGNPDILKAAGIETRVTNPNVGENLQEHMLSMMIYELDPSVLTPEVLRSDPVLAAAADEQYVTSKTGPRTAVGYSAAYLPFSHFTPPKKLATLASQLPIVESANSRQRDQILSQRFSSPEPSGQIEFLFDVSNYSPFFKSEPGKRYGTMMQMLQYPFSHGSIHVPPAKSSSEPTTSDDKPIIDPQYYGGKGGEVDFQTMVAAQKFGHKICSTAPLSSIIRERVFPAPSKDISSDDEDFSAWVRDSTITDWHPVGTCAMGGHEGIKGGVVDDRLRVYGVKGLRVCDASIMPLQIAAHLQATVYAIGEKGAAMMLEDWEESAKGLNGHANGVDMLNGNTNGHTDGVNGSANAMQQHGNGINGMKGTLMVSTDMPRV